MDSAYWKEQEKYLKLTRKHMWNEDYFAFLVQSVWKLKPDADILDLGCGYGDLCARLLPLLSEKSTYTGVDFCRELLEEGRKRFWSESDRIQFIESDINEVVPERTFDVVICQSFLRHIPNVENILKKMCDCASEGGIVICIEPDRRMEHAGVYQDDPGYDMFKYDDFLKEKWMNEFQKGERDFRVGMKIPVYMERLGLQNVGVRVNDYVEFISLGQDGEEYAEHLAAFGETTSENDGKHSVVSAKCHLISFGRKK